MMTLDDAMDLVVVDTQGQNSREDMLQAELQAEIQVRDLAERYREILTEVHQNTKVKILIKMLTEAAKELGTPVALTSGFIAGVLIGCEITRQPLELYVGTQETTRPMPDKPSKPGMPSNQLPNAEEQY